MSLNELTGNQKRAELKRAGWRTAGVGPDGQRRWRHTAAPTKAGGYTTDEAYVVELKRSGADLLARHGIEWPSAVRFPGSPVLYPTSLVKLERLENEGTVMVLQPSYPSRVVGTAFEIDEDGEEFATAFRDLTTEEWAVALSEYNSAMAEWRRTMGQRRIKAGPAIVRGTFEVSAGDTKGHVTGRHVEDRGWMWEEMNMTVER